MKDADKNRCPEKALKRAGADARCALRKLGALDALQALADKGPEASPEESAAALQALIQALGLGGKQ